MIDDDGGHDALFGYGRHHSKRRDKVSIDYFVAFISGLLLTTECLITELPKGKKADGGDHGHDHGGMGCMM